jgi:hypothetical protein
MIFRSVPAEDPGCDRVMAGIFFEGDFSIAVDEL